MQPAAKLMRCLSNLNRLMIMWALAEGEQSVSQLEEQLGIRQPILSQHLADLRKAGAIEPRRASKSVFYKISDASTASFIAALHGIFCETVPRVPGSLPKSQRGLELTDQAAVFAQVSLAQIKH